MQILPVIGTGLLMGLAALATLEAIRQDIPSVEKTSTRSDGFQVSPEARQISLTPSARGDAFYTAILERPLFHETRRPIAPEIAAAPSSETVAPTPASNQDVMPPPDVRLLGILSGGARTAALISVKGDDARWLDQGTRIEGWTLLSIASDHIIFVEQEREYRVELYQR